MSGGDFLSRWSRRKLEVRRGEAPDTRPDAPPQPGDDPARPPVPAEEEALSAEEIAALPPVESLTPESDVAVFLRKGVPQALRNAALRRVWALDPEIRDFVGEARDYAWDWNVPGGVPMSGPLEPGTDIGRMVEEVFGRPAPGPDEEAPQTRTAAAPPDNGADAAAALPPDAQEPPEEKAGTPPREESSTSRDDAEPARKRRHGGAKPA